MNRTVKGYLAAIASAVIFGCNPLAATFVYAHGLNPMMLIFFRNTLALPVFLVIIRLRGEQLAPKQGEMGPLAAFALTDGLLTQLLLFSSYNFIPSGTATTFHFVYPTVVILGNFLIFRQKTSLGQLAGLLLCTLGILAFYTPGGEALDPFGCALALLSGVAYASYIILLEHKRPAEISSFKLQFYVSAMTALGILPICFATGSFALPDAPIAWLVCFVYAVSACLGGLVLFQVGTKLIGGQRTALLSAFEPITSVVVGILVLNEALTWRSALGSGLIIAATITIAMSDLLKHKKETAA